MNTDYKVYPVRTSAILTGSYVAGTVISDVKGSNTMDVLVAFTIGSLTDASIKIEYSTDGTTYYQESAQATTTGVTTETLQSHKFAATGNYRIQVPIKAPYIKISAIGNGTATSSLMGINAVISTR